MVRRPSKRQWVRILAALVIGFALYAAAGFWGAPWLLRTLIVDHSRKNLGLQASVGEIRFNPFLFQLRVADFALSEPSGGKLLGFERLFVDFRPGASLWRREYTFREIDLVAPVIDALVDRQGKLNLAQLLPKSPAVKPASKPAPLPRIRVAVLHVATASLRYEDRAHPGDFSLLISPADLELHNFTTGAAGGRFSLTASTALGEHIDWHGQASLQPLASHGEIRISALRARTIEALLRDRLARRLPLALTAGRLGFDVRYRFDARPTPQLRLDGGRIVGQGLAIAPAGTSEEWIRLPTLAVSGASLDLDARQVHVDRVALTGLYVDAWMGARRKLNLDRLLGPTPQRPATPRWRVELTKIAIRNARLSAQDRGIRPAAKFLLAPLSLDVDGASLDLARPIRVALSTGVNGAGRFAARGEVVPSPLSANLKIVASRLDLRALQPYIAQATLLTLERGLLGASLNLRLRHAGPTLRISGQLNVDRLRTIDDDLHRDLVDWRALEVRGLRFQLHPARLRIARIVAVRPYARVIVEPNHNLNVKRILMAPTPRLAARRRRAVAARRASGRHAPRAMRVTIGRVTVLDGQANFSDLSITPNFSAGIDKLSGNLRALDSAPGSRAIVDLHGEVGPYAPVKIEGTVNLFGPALYTDLAMSFRNMDLTIFNPYSGKFAGYDITKGKLTTDLHYLVQNGKLKASHHVVIDQLEFGAKTHSKDAISLPIKLAVALLKDRHGVIDVNLPVSGSLNDPKFRLAPLIWQVLVNLLEKAVTAPFKLLGALFGAGPQIQFADFPPGSAALDATDLAHMRTVAKALHARPQLKVDVPIAPLAALDAPALAEAKFEAQIAEQMLGRRIKPRHVVPAGTAPSAGAVVASNSAMASFEALDARSQLAVLSGLYRTHWHAAPVYPQTTPPPKTAAAAQAAKITYLEARLKSRIQIGPGDLKELAEQRALALEKALLAGTGIDPARVFLVINGKVTAHQGAVRLRLSLR